jgi:hypothetical protein
MDPEPSTASIKATRTAMPTTVAVAVGIGLGLAIALTLRFLRNVAGTWTIVGVWLLFGLITFFTFPLEFFPQKPADGRVSGQSAPSEGKKRKPLPWIVRLLLTILLTPLILGGLSIRRTARKK